MIKCRIKAAEGGKSSESWYLLQTTAKLLYTAMDTYKLLEDDKKTKSQTGTYVWTNSVKISTKFCKGLKIAGFCVCVVFLGSLILNIHFLVKDDGKQIFQEKF